MSYNTIADYSKVLGGKNLPYVVELDEESCILNPSAGKNQKFCYSVTTVSGVSNTESMESLLLGIHPGITPEQIKNIAVSINGTARTVRFNTSNPNVRLTSSGLRFDFEVNKNNSIMKICFELTSAHEVCSIPVNLYGEDATKTGLTIGGPCGPRTDPDPDEEPDEENCFENSTCTRYGLKVFEFSVPVSIKPVVVTHKPEVRCLGEAKIEPGKKECHDEREYEHEHDQFDFTLSQKISVKTPVEFIVKTCYDKLCVEERKDEDETGDYDD
ncbi:MAG: hypothetical protein FWD25_04180 [Clostridia bacterium]|nr:hypothetical protein [Clostridia bacterium]